MRGRRILLVDDELQLVQLMSRYLERLGYETVEAGTTGEGWRLVEQEGAFTVAIIDLSLENPSGESLAGRVMEEAPQTKVLLTSGYAFDAQPLAAAFPGRVEFLAKPFSGEMLAAVVKRMTGSETLRAF